MKPRIYLSGNMTPNSDNYYKWTDDFRFLLSDKYECSTSFHKDTPQFIVRHDLARLKRCDILVVNVGVSDLSHHLTGAIVEVYEAYKQNIPVYVFCSEDLITSEQSKSPWFEQFITAKFKTKEDLITFLLYDDNLISGF